MDDTGMTWAKRWLEEVAEARKALERAQTILDLRRSRAYGLGNPLSNAGGGTGKGGDGNRLANDVLQMMEAEQEDSALSWARNALAQFDMLAELNRPALRGAVLNGLDVAEMKYRLGAKEKVITAAFGMSRSKLHADLGAFIDYMDYIGRAEAFKLEQWQPVVEDDAEDDRPMVHETAEDKGTGHARIYSDLQAMADGCKGM